MNRRVTLLDVAKDAGVARSTVSMALQNHPRISERTRVSVRESADRLGYRPDPAMTALAAYRQGKRQTRLHAGLALLHNWGADLPRSSFWGATAASMQSEADRLGYYLDLMPVEPGKTDGPTLTRTLRARSIGGVLFFPTRGPDPVHYEVDWSQFVLVGMEFGRPNTHMPHVVRDYSHRFLLAGNVGFTSHPLNVLLAGEWHDGVPGPPASCRPAAGHPARTEIARNEAGPTPVEPADPGGHRFQGSIG